MPGTGSNDTFAPWFRVGYGMTKLIVPDAGVTLAPALAQTGLREVMVSSLNFRSFSLAQSCKDGTYTRKLCPVFPTS